MPTLIMITGPIASGKSAVAAQVVKRLRGQGKSTVLVAVDSVAEMALPTLPDWQWAHSIHAKLVGLWLTTGIEVVVDEGTSSPSEVRQVLAQVPNHVLVFHVVLNAEFDSSLRRAQGDPTRGISADPAFLRQDHDAFGRQAADLPCDLKLFVEGRTPQSLAEDIIARVIR